jgi:hypothetical protein
VVPAACLSAAWIHLCSTYFVLHCEAGDAQSMVGIHRYVRSVIVKRIQAKREKLYRTRCVCTESQDIGSVAVQVDGALDGSDRMWTLFGMYLDMAAIACVLRLADALDGTAVWCEMSCVGRLIVKDTSCRQGGSCRVTQCRLMRSSVRVWSLPQNSRGPCIASNSNSLVPLVGSSPGLW